MQEDVWLLIPCYNVGRYLDLILTETANYIPVERTVIVNDGSDDETPVIAKKRGVHLINHDVNIGKGKSLRDGLELARAGGGKWVITMDGDGQHDPIKIQEFIEAGKRGNFDLIIGSRRRNNTKMPWDRKLSNWLSSLLISIVLGQRMEDVQCGYRMVKLEALKDLIFTRDKYDFETEFLLKTVQSGARVGWVSIPTLYSGETSSIRRIPDTLRFIKIVLLYLMRAI